ncbi:hypothetical protein [Paenibacillus faecalis]|uniref:hypothetical protein n=1 Tax=Paenibacillus faecalis TaxID=2079532 RepID=UPI000D0FA48D|nr:hypothetical protein [Paenibacillus faecalis]
MGKGLIAGLLSICLLTIFTGCTKEYAKEEMKKYNMEAYEEGNQEKKTEGTGLNGKLLNTMKDLFKEHDIVLTNETYFEDEAGTMSYQYRINDDSSQLITVYIFADEQARRKGIDELYGTGRQNKNEVMDQMIFEEREGALVYTSAGEKKDQYSKQVKAVASKVLNELPLKNRMTTPK